LILVLHRLTLVVRAKNLGSKTRAAQIFRLSAAIAMPTMCVLYTIFAVGSVVTTDKDLSSTFYLISNGVLLLTILLIVLTSCYFVYQVMSWVHDTHKQNKTLALVRQKTIWMIVSLASLLLYVVVLFVELSLSKDRTPTVWISMLPTAPFPTTTN